MKILVIGSGGREHALVWKLSKSKHVAKIFCAPGNPGISELAECVFIDANDIESLLVFAQRNKIDLTIVGPEAPLALGVVDLFKKSDLKIFGPEMGAARLESSKAYAKKFCERYKIPSACSKTFSDFDDANEYILVQNLPLVIKADGLAAGKGVVICKTHDEALSAAKEMLVSKSFGMAGNKIVIEEFLDGEEASFIAICDGNHVLPLASSQDHKAVFDGDKGPNTGGMGAVSPAKVVTDEVAKKVMEKIMLPASHGLVTDGRPFVGVLYAGLMIKNGEPKLLEFNVRFGDPETEPLMMRLKTDLVEILMAAVTGALDRVSLEWDLRSAASVVLASQGYPGDYKKGHLITGLDLFKNQDDVVVFHSGTKKNGDQILSNGGRVLCVTALGNDMKDAISRAYETVTKISWEGMHYRKDIGWRSL